jgi:transcriptional regulator with XRE-family HTH domain
MAEEMERIGGRMKERREELGLKQREVAERIPGKTESKDISRWENGRHRPESDTLGLIAKALETDISDLYAGPLAGRKPASTTSPLDALSKSDLPAEVSEVVEALRVEMVAMRTQLLARIEKGQQETEALLRKQGLPASRKKSSRK